MPSIKDKLASLWKEFRANLIVQFLTWLGGSSMVGAAGRALWQIVHQNAVDWIFLASLFLCGLVFLLIALWQQLKNPTVSVADVESLVKKLIREQGLISPEQSAPVTSSNLCSSVGVRREDPRVYLSLKEAGEVPDHPLESRLVLSNRGGEPAHKVSVEEVQLRTGNIKFDDCVAVIPANDSAEIIPHCTGFGPVFSKDVMRALEREWNTYTDQLTREKMLIPISVAYKDFQGTRFEANCDLVFNGIAHALRSIGVSNRVVEFDNLTFRKVTDQ